MVYEKFNYFFLKYPSFLSGVSLVVIDELQVINDPERGPLLEEMLVNLQNQEQKIKIISLSAFLEN
jgi:helicase